MAGEMIRQARAACVDIMRRLRAADRLNVIVFDHRVEKLSKENDDLRDAVDELRVDLDEAQGRSKETLAALSKNRRRPGRMKWLVLAGGAYVLGAKAGRARYEQITGWARSLTQTNGNGSTVEVTDTPKKA